MLCKAFNILMNRYNDSRNHYNDSLEHIDLSENSQNVANVLWSVQRFGESYNDSRNYYNDSLFIYILFLNSIYFYYVV
jgi:hypothetical protein